MTGRLYFVTAGDEFDTAAYHAVRRVVEALGIEGRPLGRGQPPPDRSFVVLPPLLRACRLTEPLAPSEGGVAPAGLDETARRFRRLLPVRNQFLLFATLGSGKRRDWPYLGLTAVNGIAQLLAAGRETPRLLRADQVATISRPALAGELLRLHHDLRCRPQDGTLLNEALDLCRSVAARIPEFSRGSAWERVKSARTQCDAVLLADALAEAARAVSAEGRTGEGNAQGTQH